MWCMIELCESHYRGKVLEDEGREQSCIVHILERRREKKRREAERERERASCNLQKQKGELGCKYVES